MKILYYRFNQTIRNKFIFITGAWGVLTEAVKYKYEGNKNQTKTSILNSILIRLYGPFLEHMGLYDVS